MEKDIIIFEPHHDPALLIGAGEYAYEQGKNAAATEAKIAQNEGAESDAAAETGSRIAQEKWRKKNEAARVSAEEARKIAEGSDDTSSEYYEEGRCANERFRQAAEGSILTQSGRAYAEKLRVEAEDSRRSAEEQRTTTFRTNEGKENQEASATGSRWQRFKYAENQRQNTFNTNEGEASDAEDENGSRWARYNHEEEGRTQKFNNKLGDVTQAISDANAATGRAVAAATSADNAAASAQQAGQQASTKIGDLSTLNTENKSNVVGAVNEVNTNVLQLGASAGQMITQLQHDLGDKSQLTTDAKNNLVAAINEVDGKTDEFQTELDGKVTNGNNEYVSIKVESGHTHVTLEDGHITMAVDQGPYISLDRTEGAQLNGKAIATTDQVPTDYIHNAGSGQNVYFKPAGQDGFSAITNRTGENYLKVNKFGVEAGSENQPFIVLCSTNSVVKTKLTIDANGARIWRNTSGIPTEHEIATSDQIPDVSGKADKTYVDNQLATKAPNSITAVATKAALYASQSYTDEEKTTARTNIGAASSAELGEISSEITIKSCFFTTSAIFSISSRVIMPPVGLLG